MKVVVVGGGVMGCGVALRLRQAGAEATVLERSIPGAEASSAAAGILGPQLEAEGPSPFLDLCLESRRRYRPFAEELAALSGIDIAYLPSGVLRVAFTAGDLAHLRERARWQREKGLRAELLSGDEARRMEAALSQDALGAAYLPDDHQVDNRLLVKALSMACARAGVEFRGGYVRGVVVERERAIGVDLDGARLEADAVVVAAGSWTGLVQGIGIDPSVVRPARGQMIELGARLPPFTRILSSEKGYLVPRRDGRVIAGSTLEMVGFDKEVTARGLADILDMALQLCPALAQAPVQRSWAGLRPFTEDRLPLLGPGPVPGLFLATGHFRNGILLAPITADVVAASVLGRDPGVDLAPFSFARLRSTRQSAHNLS